LLGRDDIETEQALKDIASRVIDLMKYSEEKSISILEAMSKFQL